MMDHFRVLRKQKWREPILPAIFPYYVTEGITAADGAWNASNSTLLPQLDTAIQWGRYGELFGAADDRKLILTGPEDEVPG